MVVVVEEDTHHKAAEGDTLHTVAADVPEVGIHPVPEHHHTGYVAVAAAADNLGTPTADDPMSGTLTKDPVAGIQHQHQDQQH